MKQLHVHQSRITHLLLATLILLLGTTSIVTASAAHYQITNYTIDSAGYLKVGEGRFQLSGTIGQGDSTNEQIAGRRTLTGGFWSRSKPPTTPAGPTDKKIFLPLVSR